MPNRRVISTQETALHSTSVRNHTASIRPAKPPTVPPGEALDASIRQDLIALVRDGKAETLVGLSAPVRPAGGRDQLRLCDRHPLLVDRDSSGMCGER